MKQKILGALLALSLCLGASLFIPTNSYAAKQTCLPWNFVGEGVARYYDDPNATITFTVGGLNPNASYTIHTTGPGCRFGIGTDHLDCPSYSNVSAMSNAGGQATFTFPDGSAFESPTNRLGDRSMWLLGPGTDDDGCKLVGKFGAVNSLVCTPQSFLISQVRNDETCYYKQHAANSCLNDSDPIGIAASGLRKRGTLYDGEFDFHGSWARERIRATSIAGSSPPVSVGVLTPQAYSVSIEEIAWLNWDACKVNFIVSGDCQTLCLKLEDLGDPTSLGPDKFSLCQQINDPTAQQKCLQCSGGEDGTEGIWTAVGCISKEPEEILGRFIRLGISMGGGVALLMILSAGFTMTISQGNAQKTAQAKEMMTAAITGLLFIIFSVTILQFIGFSILKIPGFGG